MFSEAKQRGRSILVFMGLLLLVLGIILLAVSLLCWAFPWASVCWHLHENGSLEWMVYLGLLFIALFCCAPCFALTEDEMKRVRKRCDENYMC